MVTDQIGRVIRLVQCCLMPIDKDLE